MYIGNVKIDSTASLAPMAGITDKAFREICSLFGSSYTTSEMISTKGIIYSDRKTLDLADNTNLNKPFAIQLFGSYPNDFYEAVKIILKFNPDIIDINMGCPAPKIIKSGSGSALMQNPKLCGKIVKAVKNACNIPVTVKIRAGFNNKNINAVEVAKECELNGADAITIHPRTRDQMYSGKADLDIIKDVVSAVNIPVIGNGDITNYNQAKFMMDYTKCSMVAVGRGALGNPWIFRDINYHKNFSTPTIKERIDIMKLHFNKMIQYKGISRAVKESRKHLSWYTKGLNNAASIRKDIFNIKNLNDFDNICKNIINMCTPNNN